MKSVCQGFILISFHLTSFGQTTIADFIRSAMEDPKIKTFNDQLAYLQTKPYRLSPLQKLEFRTKNREMLSYQQEVALRFTPANPWEIRNNNRYFLNYQASMALEKEITLKESLVERYKATILYLYDVELKRLAEEARKLTADQLSVLEKQSTSSSFDPDEYVKLRVDLLDKVVDIEEIDFEVTNRRNEINRLCPDMLKRDLEWDTQDLIGAERIEQVMDSLVSRSGPSALLAYQQQQVKLAGSEYNLEKSNFTLGFLQTEYDHRRVVQERTPVNISLGITIPVTNPNKGDMTKRKLDVIEAEYDLMEARNAAETGSGVLLNTLTHSIRQYNNLQEKMNELRDGNLAQSLSLIKGGDPIVIIQFNESLVKLKNLQAKMKRNLLLAYIDFLAFNDKLQQLPLVNYLSDSLK